MMLNHLKKTLMEFNWPKMLKWGCFGKFSEKSPILGTLLTLKYFSQVQLNLTRQDASFKDAYDYILADFFDKKVTNLVETQKFCRLLFNHSFLHHIITF